MKTKLVKGAIFVTIATFFVKVLSIIYKVPYQNITGDKGFYIYQQLYPIYAIVISVATFALPLSISDLIVKTKQRKKILSSIFFISIILSLILSILVLVFKNKLGVLFNDTKLSTLFLPLIPLFLLIPLASIIRGNLYSEVKNIKHVGISIIIEQIVRISFILFVLFKYLNGEIIDLYEVAKYSLLAYSIGLLVSILYIFIMFDYRNIKLKYANINYGLLILKRGFFLLISSSILLLLNLIDSLTIIKILSKEMNIEKAMIIKGVYDRILPLIQASLFFVTPILSSIIPHVDIENSKKQLGRIIELILYLALPITLGLIIVLDSVNKLLFMDNQYTYVLQVSSLSIIFYAVLLAYTAIIKDNKKILITIIIGIVIKYIGNIVLITYFGIVGASISSVVSILTMNLIIIIMNRNVINFRVILIMKILLSAIIMSLLILLLQYFGYLQSLYIKIIVGIITYFLTSYILNIRKNHLLIS